MIAGVLFFFLPDRYMAACSCICTSDGLTFIVNRNFQKLKYIMKIIRKVCRIRFFLIK